VLLKRQAQIKQKLDVGNGGGEQDATPLRSELKAVEQEMTDLGGLEWYQRGASLCARSCSQDELEEALGRYMPAGRLAS
jgi:hypothetical protein